MKSRSVCSLCSVFVSLVFASSFASAQNMRGPVAVRELKHVTTPRLSDLVPSRLVAAQPDAAASVVRAVSTTGGLNFDGAPGTGYNYSDVTGAAGATQYVQVNNLRYTVYDKTTGNKVLGPVAENVLWKTFGGPCQTANNGDGTVMYDSTAQRWVFQHHAEPVGGPYLDCIAVSATSDATGAYYLYGFELTLNLPDQPKLAIWPDAYYIGQNLLNPATKGFLGAQACALDRTNMLLGNVANAICFQGSISLPTILPVSWVGPTPPPAGSPEYFFELDQRPGVGANQMNEFLFHVDFVNPNNSTYSFLETFKVPAYRDACPTACVPQLDTTNLMKATGDRLMAPLVYRNFGDHESILLTHAVSTGKALTLPSGIRWYELRTPLTPVIYQYGTFAPDTNYRWVPSMNMDQMGDIAVGYSVSSAIMHPAIRYTGWTPTDPLGQMEAETSVIEGTGSQQSTNTTWSNYSGMSVDPADDCTFWYTNQYYAADSTNKWNTRIVSFKFPSCAGSN
ncbi:MAG TPA: hypothetical protein VMH04_21345 [Candidatus Solibacter sp.]|nr:hypothetical protein [Candidatus Solibacter sp.]